MRLIGIILALGAIGWVLYQASGGKEGEGGLWLVLHSEQMGERQLTAGLFVAAADFCKDVDALPQICLRMVDLVLRSGDFAKDP